MQTLDAKTQLYKLCNIQPVRMDFIIDNVPTLSTNSALVNLSVTPGADIRKLEEGCLYASMTHKASLTAIYNVIRNNGRTVIATVVDVIDTNFVSRFAVTGDYTCDTFLLINRDLINSRKNILTSLLEVGMQRQGIVPNMSLMEDLNMMAGRFKRLRDYIWERENDEEFVNFRASEVIDCLRNEILTCSSFTIDIAMVDFDFSFLFFGRDLDIYKSTKIARRHYVENRNRITNKGLKWLTRHS